jgi:UDP-2,3-diacylglucosamine hydrolase
MTIAFISDLHLDASRPAVTDLFHGFLADSARRLEALYILGDLFEAWIGDDDPDEHHAAVKRELRELTGAGVPGYFMHGNRDFLVGDVFTRETGLTLLDDPTVIDLCGTRTLLSHGDALCTDDTDYQAFRKTVHDPAWQQGFLARPIDTRREFAAQARTESRRAQQGKSIEIMDVNPEAVASLMREYDVHHLIHGHTHRPDVHHFRIDGAECTRTVLGDWYEQGSVLWCDGVGCRLESMPLR